MGEFKEKLKFLLKDKDANDELLFNRSLLKIHKKIKRENNSKSILTKIEGVGNKNDIIDNSEKNKLCNYSFNKFKRGKSTNVLSNLIRSFSVYDIHLNKKFQNYKLYFTNNINNKRKESYLNNQKTNYILNNKINYVNSLLYNYDAYSNNIKGKNNFIKKENTFLSNKTTIYKDNANINFFQTKNKFSYNIRKNLIIANNNSKVKSKFNDTFIYMPSNINHKYFKL